MTKAFICPEMLAGQETAYLARPVRYLSVLELKYCITSGKYCISLWETEGE